MYVILWQYRVKPDHKSSFTELYGSDGDWCKWFRKSPHYLGTDLLESHDDPLTLITIDKWKSKSAYDSYYKSDPETFNRLDELGDTFTDAEDLLGTYSVLSD